jgi:hypothetical protein
VDSAQRAELTEQYLADPFLRRLYDLVMAAGPLRSVTIDLTEVCNLRCDGCYFFVENMDDSKAPKDGGGIRAVHRIGEGSGTNYATVLGGEPSLMLDRLRSCTRRSGSCRSPTESERFPWRALKRCRSRSPSGETMPPTPGCAAEARYRCSERL